MVMGVQRSGTNALRRSLSLDPRVAGFNESKDSPLFKNWYLRREASIRDFLNGVPGTVLIKPISETRKRTVADIFEEYQAYDLWMPWIYRDPVNVYHSRIRRWPELTDIDRFVDSWNSRNRSALEAIPGHADRMAIVRYEECIADPTVFWGLCRFLNVEGEYLFRRDSAGGYRRLDRELQQRILEGTSEVLQELDAARRFGARAETWAPIENQVAEAPAGADAALKSLQPEVEGLRQEVAALREGQRRLVELVGGDSGPALRQKTVPDALLAVSRDIADRLLLNPRQLARRLAAVVNKTGFRDG